MSGIADLSAAVASLTTEVQAAQQALTDLTNKVNQLQASQGLSSDEQAQLDAAVSGLATLSSQLQSAAAAAEALVNPPAPAPAAAAEEVSAEPAAAAEEPAS